MPKEFKTDAFSLSGVKIAGYVDRLDTIGRLCDGKRTIALYVGGVDLTFEDLTTISSRYAFTPTVVEVNSFAARSVHDGLFEVAVLGNVIEHVSNPGQILDHLRNCLVDGGSVIITCPNAFGGPNYARFLLGRYREGPDHVQSYTKHTLANLMARHGFRLVAAWTGLDQIPSSPAQRAKVHLGSRLLHRFPEVGGTLILAGEALPRAVPS